METYDLSYADKQAALLLRADLDAGWRKLEKTFGFFAQKKIHYRDNWLIRTQLAVIAQPATFDARASSFPGGVHEFGDRLVSYTIDGTKTLSMKIALTRDQPWRTTSTNRPGLFIENLAFLIIDSQFWFDLRAWVVFHAPPRAPVPDIRVWCERFFVPGGQFESNRRRH